jgi:hypothetical protein
MEQLKDGWVQGRMRPDLVEHVVSSQGYGAGGGVAQQAGGRGPLRETRDEREE